MKNLMGASTNNTNEMQGLANKYADGDMPRLVNTMNNFFVSVSDGLPRLQPTRPVFVIREPIPAELIISLASTETALTKVKCNKATGPDNIPPWILRDYAQMLPTLDTGML